MPNVNLLISNFQSTGSTVNFPQYEVTIQATWVDVNGVSQSRSETVLFPNILNDPGLSGSWLEENLTSLIILAVRQIHNID